MSHPSPEELARFLRGELGRPECRHVVRHLLTGCATCVAVTAPIFRLAEAPLPPGSWGDERRSLMPDAPEPGRLDLDRLDLDRYSEALRRWLYDRVVQIQFSPPDSTLTPDEAALQVLCVLGRWFAVWTDPEQPPAMPARLRVQVARIEVSREDPADIQLYAV